MKKSQKPGISACRKRGNLFLKYLDERNVKVDGQYEKQVFRELFNKNFRTSEPDLDWRGYNFSNVFYALTRVGAVSYTADGFVSFTQVHGRRSRKPVSLAVDQHLSVNRSKQKATSDKDKAVETDLPRHVVREGMFYRCTACKAICTSENDLKNHIGGRRHRTHTLISALATSSSLMMGDKHGINIIANTDDQQVNVILNEREEKTVTMTIKNNTEGTAIYFNHCEMLRKYRLFTLSDRDGVTDGTKEVLLRAGEEYTVQVAMKAKHLGHFHAYIAFEFESPNPGGKSISFTIVRKVLVTCTNSIIKDIQPTTPYKRPKRVAISHEPKLEMVDGVRLDMDDSCQLEREVPLEPFFVPSDLRHLVNKGFEYARLPDGHEQEYLSQLLNVFRSDISMEKHEQRFGALLHIEEIQMEVDIRKYDMEGVTLRKTKSGRLLVLRVPGLAENRPSVLRGDHLFLRKLKPDGLLENKEYKGYVHHVGMEEVELGVNARLLQEFIPNMKFNVRFTFNRTPLRTQHRALQLCQEHSLDQLLFPAPDTASSWQPLQPVDADLRFYNADVGTNIEQARAVRHIVAGSSRPAPYLIFGPPGTGKTMTMVEAMKQVVKCIPSVHILACAPSNSAADLLAERLKGHIDKNKILRMNAISRSWSTVPEKIQDISNWKHGKYFYPKKQELCKYQVIVCTLVTAGRLASANFPQGHFTHIFIDECGHAVEPEGLIAIAGLLEVDVPLDNGGQIVLAGDPKQLGPILRSPIVLKYGLDKSLLERLMTKSAVYSRHDDSDEVDIVQNHLYDPKVLTKLVRNYRSHPDILSLPNELFYDRELEVYADKMLRESFCQWEYLPKKGFPVVFHGVTGKDMREEQSPSFFNPEEAAVVLDYVKKLKDGKPKITLKEIGIISPYRKQVQKIQKLLQKNSLDNGIKVGSVEEFQGQERRVIIISTVRTNPDYLSFDLKFGLGFLRNPKRFNVAVTRAKALLIVIGNPFVLCQDSHWKKFLEFCVEHGGYTGCYCDKEDNVMEDIIQRFEAVHLDEQLESLSKDSEGGDGEQVDNPDSLDVSEITQQEEPEWRSET